MRERAIKFLACKLKTLAEDVMTKEVEEYVFAETKKVRLQNLYWVKLDKYVLFISSVRSSNVRF